MTLNARLLIPAVIILGALLLLRARNSGIDFVEHQRFDRVLDEVQKLDATLN